MEIATDTPTIIILTGEDATEDIMEDMDHMDTAQQIITTMMEQMQ
jgi:hypothetical protein